MPESICEFYWSFLLASPGLLWESIQTLVGAFAAITFLILLFNRSVGKKLAGWDGISRKWALIPLGLLFAWALLKANYQEFQVCADDLTQANSEKGKLLAEVSELQGELKSKQEEFAEVVAANRPYIDVRLAKAQPIQILYESGESEFLITFEIENTGKTPARNVRFNVIDLIIGDKKSPTKEGDSWAVMPGKKATYKFSMFLEKQGSPETPFAEDFISAAVRGRFLYEDVAGRQYFTSLSFHVEKNLQVRNIEKQIN